jgi:hypothetical protein
MSNPKKRITNIVMPSLAAAALAAVAFSTASPGTPTAQPPAHNAPGVAPQHPMAQKTAGDPEDPATWRLPIEAYMLTKAQARLVSDTQGDLLDQCMAKAGHPAWTPPPDLPTLGGKTLTDWRYGIHDAALAAERGYHPDAEEQKAYDAAMGAGAVDKTGADESTVRGCVEQVNGQVPSASPRADLVQKISGEAFIQAGKDPQVIRVFAEWSSCMKDKGFTYAKPMDANDDPAFGDPTVVTDTEVATAKADIQCRDKLDVEKTWFDAETKLQQAAITKHQAELNTVANDNKTVVAKAKAAAH